MNNVSTELYRNQRGTMPHHALKVPERGMFDAYELLLSERGFVADAGQQAAAERLQTLYYQLLSFKVVRRSTLRRVFSHPEVPRGVYFWGRSWSWKKPPDGLLLQLGSLRTETAHSFPCVHARCSRAIEIGQK